jgi:hypothetical protein
LPLLKDHPNLVRSANPIMRERWLPWAVAPVIVLWFVVAVSTVILVHLLLS